jgi:hypothetical protein
MYVPQAQILLGAAEGISGAAHATIMATSQNILNFLPNFTPLFSS